MVDLPKLSKRDLSLTVFFGLCDLVTAGIFVLFLPAYFTDMRAGVGMEKLILGLKILLILSLFASAAGHLLRRKWGPTIYFVQLPFRLLTSIFSLSALLYLVPIMGNPQAAAGLHMAVVSADWIRLFLSFGLRRALPA
jgi:hypothetical protein